MKRTVIVLCVLVAASTIAQAQTAEDADSANLHLTVAVPFATSESLGLPNEGSYSRAGTWIMEAGTSAAHIMLPGR